MLEEAIKTAIKMETDAMAFYREAAEKSSHPFGKKMYEGFIKDEMRHLQMLEDVMKGLDIKIGPVTPKDEIKTVFSELKDKMMERVKATTDEISAVGIALDFEKAGFEYYKNKAAEAAAGSKEKALFERLALEEQDHYQILENTHSFLKDTGDWFMWQEQGIVEG